MKKHMFAGLLLSALAVVPAYAGPAEDAQAAFAAWRTALTSGKPDPVVALYDEHAVLLATLSPKPLLTQAERLGYFGKLTAHPKLNATVEESHTQVLDENNVVLSGLYTFRFEEAGKPTAIPARFTFVYEKKDGRWVIVEHHSSKIPAA